MGCGSSQGAIERPPNQKLKVWGDYFSPETRTILNLCQISGVDIDLEIVDQFEGDHRKELYKSINPTGQIPTITEGRYLILGGYNIFLSYLANNHARIHDKMQPDDFRLDIEKHLMWFQSIMKVCTSRLTRMIVGPIALGDKAVSPEELQKDQDDLFRKILPRLDTQLKDKDYMCGSDLTVVDIQYYNEIVTLCKLLNRELTETQYPNLSGWYLRLGQIPEIQETDRRLQEVIVKRNLATQGP